jgi:hypothetical protein
MIQDLNRLPPMDLTVIATVEEGYLEGFTEIFNSGYSAGRGRLGAGGAIIHRCARRHSS